MENHKLVVNSKNENRRVLAKFCYSSEESKSKCSTLVLYLHGFPDLSIHPKDNSFCSRLPRKFRDRFVKEGFCFAAFNFSGCPGSDSDLNFRNKTISKEINDALAVIDYALTFEVPTVTNLCIIGISTGAIVASCLRRIIFNHIRESIKVAFVCIAGLLDVKSGMAYDFTDAQIAEFDTLGYCWKEFYLPKDFVYEGEFEQRDNENENDSSCKIFIPLDREYYDECMNGSIKILDSSCAKTEIESTDPPILILHGEDDKNVPIENGKSLYEALSEPKEFLEIKRGNHLLTNSKAFKSAARAIDSFINTYLDKFED